MGTRYIGTERVEVAWITTVAVETAPTAAELNAGVDLTGYIVANGLDLPASSRTVDASDASSKRDKTVSGTYGGDQGTIEFHRERPAAQDTAWTTLPRGTAGFIAVAPYGLATPGTWAIADVVDLYPAEIQNRNAINLLGRTETLRGRVDVSITDDVTEDFPIAA